MKKLTTPMKEMLEKVPEDWAVMPWGIGATNRTLTALEKRGLVKLKYRGGWQWFWRRSPSRSPSEEPELTPSRTPSPVPTLTPSQIYDASPIPNESSKE